MTNNFVFEADLAAKKIYITREFNAPIEKVWKAWTEPALLEKWIAPKPWTAESKTLDFTVGGIWLYAMVSPEGQKHWVYAEFTAIENGSSFSQPVCFVMRTVTRLLMGQNHTGILNSHLLTVTERRLIR